MSLPWFRMYAEFATDPTVQCLAFEDQRHYVVTLCLKCSGVLDKDFPSEQQREHVLRRAFGLDTAALAEGKRRLVEAGLIDESWQPVAWDKRQFASDSSKERVRKYRAKRKKAGLQTSSTGYRRHWGALMDRDDQQCVYCGSKEKLCIDHMIPVAQGGTDDIDNLAVACKECNSGKAGRTPDQAGFTIKSEACKRALSRYVTVTVTNPSVSVSASVSASVSDSESGKEKEPIERIFEHWKTTHGHPKAVLDPKRRKLIRDRLKHYSEADLCQAITGFLNSPYHMGTDPASNGMVYDSIELFMRDSKHVDMGLKLYREPPRKLSGLTRRNIAATEGWRPPEVRNADG